MPGACAALATVGVYAELGRCERSAVAAIGERPPPVPKECRDCRTSRISPFTSQRDDLAVGFSPPYESLPSPVAPGAGKLDGFEVGANPEQELERIACDNHRLCSGLAWRKGRTHWIGEIDSHTAQ